MAISIGGSHASQAMNSASDRHAARGEAGLADTNPEPQPEAKHTCRVLVVDDDDLVRAWLTTQLEGAQFEVEVAGSGQEALRLLAAGEFHIVLTDWQMPDMDGIKLCRLIRLGDVAGYVYVLMFTNRETEQDVLTGLGAGADDYIVKGAPVEELIARLETGRRITRMECSLRTQNRENQLMSLTDAPTGAHNLEYLTQHLPSEMERSKRHGHALALLSCDIDRFKWINDRFGRSAGDELLREFVARSAKCIRKGDWLARVGADEFMIVLPETTAMGANRVAQKLREAVKRLPVPTHAGSINFTVSTGVCAVEANQDLGGTFRIEHLLRAANRGLAASKQLGGDQATFSTLITSSAVELGSAA
jgi:two-component system cell cycle response regulator